MNITLLIKKYFDIPNLYKKYAIPFKCFEKFKICQKNSNIILIVIITCITQYFISSKHKNIFSVNWHDKENFNSLTAVKSQHIKPLRNHAHKIITSFRWNLFFSFGSFSSAKCPYVPQISFV